ncbi:NAD-dependent epimerase/dehydratase family protein [Patescibacteria group bacterium]|nr:NAD-dependent epimerase/dehydratase family protein [Patescibacteria group bacterium]
MRRVAVTGGAGFLGSHLVDALLERNIEVLIIDHFQRDKRRYVPGHAKVQIADFGSGDALAALRAFAPDVVFHLAAQISVSKSVADPLHDAQANVLGTIALLTTLRDLHGTRLVFASSGGAVYGRSEVVPTPLLPDPTPASPYGVAKLICEHYIAAEQAAYGLQSVVVRFANIFGPRQQVMMPMGEGNVFAILLHRILVTGEPITIFGDGSATRDYVYVADAVNALLLAAQSGVTGTVNIGTEREISLEVLLQTIFAIHGSRHPVWYAPERPGEVTRSALEASSARELLGWKPEMTFEDGVKRMYDWYKGEFEGGKRD